MGRVETRPGRTEAGPLPCASLGLRFHLVEQVDDDGIRPAEVLLNRGRDIGRALDEGVLLQDDSMLLEFLAHESHQSGPESVDADHGDSFYLGHFVVNRENADR